MNMRTIKWYKVEKVTDKWPDDDSVLPEVDAELSNPSDIVSVLQAKTSCKHIMELYMQTPKLNQPQAFRWQDVKSVSELPQGDPLYVKVVASSGNSAAVIPAGYEGPPYKRVKAAPSDCADPVKAKAYTPDSTGDLRRRALYAGRQVDVPMTEALPAMLLGPEAGLLHDASSMYSSWRPPHWCFEAADELVQMSAKIYDKERVRHEAFLSWHTKHMPFELTYHQQGSKSSGGGDPNLNVGEYIVSGPLWSYLIVLLETKNESTADSIYQPHRHVQDYYYHEGSDRKWWNDPVICALGAPLLCLDLAGPNLKIHAMYTADTNRIVSENLATSVPLVEQGNRLPRQRDMLAATLGGYAAAAWFLAKRIQTAAGTASGSIAFQQQHGQEERVQQVVSAMKEELHFDYAASLGRAVRTQQEVQKLAELRVSAAPSHTEASLLLPYPLAALSSSSSSGSSNSSSDSYPRLLPKLGQKKPIYQLTYEGKRLFAKFTTSPYPEHVHRAWQQEQLVPPLHCSTTALPGGYNFVAMDMLDGGWIPLYEVSSSYSSAVADEAKDAARQALAQAHKILVKHGDVEKPAVHGDCRGPNIMVRRDGPKWGVRFVDLDWAGLEGVDVYPPRMSRCIEWHKDAKPRAPLRQEHDVHLLDTCGTRA